MSVRAGREFLAIPGPTTMPDEVLRAMHRPARRHLFRPDAGTDRQPAARSRALFATKGHSYIYIANGHGAWEAALTNVLSRGDKVLVLESGRFAVGWGNAAAAHGRRGRGAEGRLAPRGAAGRGRSAAAAATRHSSIKAILVVQVDTASGVVNDIEAIGKAIKAAGHPALFMVDAVASLGCMPFEMDAWGVDVAMSGSQKGLMTPPGLGFVAANDRAREVAQDRRDCARPIGTGPSATATSTTRNMPAPAGASVVRAAPGDSTAVRGRAGERVPAPPPARRSGAPRGRGLGRGPGARLQHHRTRASAPTRSRRC